jgi:hypothetical protein
MAARVQPAVAQTSGTFKTLSYDVAGLLEPFSSGSYFVLRRDA